MKDSEILAAIAEWRDAREMDHVEAILIIALIEDELERRAGCALTPSV